MRKGTYTTFNIVKTRKIWEKKGKIRKTRSTTKKRSSEIFTLKMEICTQKIVIQKSWTARNVFRPPKFGARSPPLIYSIVGCTLPNNGASYSLTLDRTRSHTVCEPWSNHPDETFVFPDGSAQEAKNYCRYTCTLAFLFKLFIRNVICRCCAFFITDEH